jgi:hypothetical protein
VNTAATAAMLFRRNVIFRRVNHRGGGESDVINALYNLVNLGSIKAGARGSDPIHVLIDKNLSICGFEPAKKRFKSKKIAGGHFRSALNTDGNSVAVSITGVPSGIFRGNDTENLIFLKNKVRRGRRVVITQEIGYISDILTHVSPVMNRSAANNAVFEEYCGNIIMSGVVLGTPPLFDNNSVIKRRHFASYLIVITNGWPD